jgi:hypothetical protein
MVEESIEYHAPHTKVPSQAIKLPKASLSMENLDISLLPSERSYMLYPEEPYKLSQRYFSDSHPDMVPLTEEQLELRHQLELKREEKELERELRTWYRMGHLDEMKKKTFEKTFTETRKYYMDLERFELLQKKSREPKAKKAGY